MHNVDWYVRHGDLVGKAAVAIGTALSVGAFVLRRRFLERDLLRMAHGNFRDASSNAVEGPVILRGRLRGGSLSTFTSLERNGGPLVHTASDDLYLDVAGERVAFSGTVGVVRGTSATSRWWRSGDGAGIGARRTFTLSDGDEVLAMGMCRGSSRSDAHYRDAAAGWELSPLPNRPQIELLAVKPVTVPRPLGAVRGAGVVLAAVTAMFLSLALAGELALTFDCAEVATAMPLTRQAGLEQMAERTYDGTRVELLQLAGMCHRGVNWMIEDGNLGGAYNAAVECELPADQARVLVAVGGYTRADELVANDPDAPADIRLAAAVGAGDWKAAIGPARQVYAGMPDMDCALALIRTRANDPGGEHLLAMTATNNERCAAMAAHQPIVAPAVAGDEIRLALDELGGDYAPSAKAATLAGSASAEPQAAIRAMYRGDWDAMYLHAGRAWQRSTDRTAAARFLRYLSAHATLDSSQRDPELVSTFESELRSSYMTPTIYLPRTAVDAPFVMVRQAADLRDLARARGAGSDAGDARMWSAVIANHLAMLDDVDRRNLFALLQR